MRITIQEIIRYTKEIKKGFLIKAVLDNIAPQRNKTP